MYGVCLRVSKSLLRTLEFCRVPRFENAKRVLRRLTFTEPPCIKNTLMLAHASAFGNGEEMHVDNESTRKSHDIGCR